MPKYNLYMTFEYEVETDDIEKTLNEFEFPTFPDIEDDAKVSFLFNTNNYTEVSNA
jgi:hypothetical protein